MSANEKNKTICQNFSIDIDTLNSMDNLDMIFQVNDQYEREKGALKGKIQF